VELNTIADNNENSSTIYVGLFISAATSIMIGRKDAITKLSSAGIDLKRNLYNIYSPTDNILSASKKIWDKAGIPVSYSTEGISKSLVRAYKKEIDAMIDGIVGKLIEQNIVSGVAIGINETISIVSDVTRKMTSNIKLLMGDFVYRLNGAYTALFAELSKVDNFKYEGPIDNKNRTWCGSHVGKILTLEQIKAWNNSSWQGKISGNPFVYRGGYRCRHIFIPHKGEK